MRQNRIINLNLVEVKENSKIMNKVDLTSLGIVKTVENIKVNRVDQVEM